MARYYSKYCLFFGTILLFEKRTEAPVIPHQIIAVLSAQTFLTQNQMWRAGRMCVHAHDGM